MSKQIEKLRKEFEEQFCEDAGNIKMLKDLYGYKIWEWINENFVPLDEPVKHDFCEWRVVDVGDQYTESIIFASCQHPHTMRERKWGIEIYKYCPHCGKEKKVEKMGVSKNSV